MARLKQILIAIDQLGNTLLGGWADETLSSRTWRLRHKQPYKFLRPAIDGLFFFQPNHCEASFIAERLRSQSPPEVRCP